LTSAIDQATLSFSPAASGLLIAIMAVLIFGIALETSVRDFRAVLRMPRAIVVGVLAQFVFLPAVFWGVIQLVHPAPSIALGLLLVACSPPGTTSNVLTHRAGGNVALSVSMSAVSNLIAIVVLPLNFAFWANRSPDTAALLRTVSVNPWEVMAHIALMIGIPFAAGILVRERRAALADQLVKVLKPVSLIVLLIFVAVAVASNAAHFVTWGPVILGIVVLLDSIAFATGYGLATVTGLDEYNRRAVAYEVGIRNTSLSLAMVFTFFGGLGGMALVTGFWGAWDLSAGLLLAAWWTRRVAWRHP
jgi:BASS family bile acid:Na+ symporter